MEWLVIGLIALGVFAYSRSRQQAGSTRAGGAQRRSRFSAGDLAAVRRTAEEDVTVYGEDLQRLDADLAGHELDEGARQDYQRALDAYEDAKASLARVTHPDEIRHVTEILGDGRYSVACVQARVAGEPLPSRRPPCFFNPQHGLSLRHVVWTPEGGTARAVPACALDADRVDAGAEPASRQVMVGTRRMPYWQAGPAYAPFGAGYFGAFGLMEGLFIGTMLGSSLDLFDGGYDSAEGAGDDGGGYDGGGDFGGGGDF
ncbi:MAG: hypothetical protein WAK18_13860 [Nocardioidaceae bacterium]